MGWLGKRPIWSATGRPWPSALLRRRPPRRRWGGAEAELQRLHAEALREQERPAEAMVEATAASGRFAEPLEAVAPAPMDSQPGQAWPAPEARGASSGRGDPISPFSGVRGAGPTQAGAAPPNLWRLRPTRPIDFRLDFGFGGREAMWLSSRSPAPTSVEVATNCPEPIRNSLRKGSSPLRGAAPAPGAGSPRRLRFARFVRRHVQGAPTVRLCEANIYNTALREISTHGQEFTVSPCPQISRTKTLQTLGDANWGRCPDLDGHRSHRHGSKGRSSFWQPKASPVPRCFNLQKRTVLLA